MKTIKTPDGDVQFPDDMSDADIEGALRKIYGGESAAPVQQAKQEKPGIIESALSKSDLIRDVKNAYNRTEDPDVTFRGTLLPYAKTKEGENRLALPGLITEGISLIPGARRAITGESSEDQTASDARGLAAMIVGAPGVRAIGKVPGATADIAADAMGAPAIAETLARMTRGVDGQPGVRQTPDMAGFGGAPGVSGGAPTAPMRQGISAGAPPMQSAEAGFSLGPWAQQLPAMPAPVQRAMAPITEKVTGDYEAQVLREAAKAARRDNNSATQLEARLAELGPQATIGDTGPNMLALAEVGAQRPGPQLTQAIDNMTARREGRSQRIANMLDERMDNRQYGGTMQELMRGRSEAGQQTYPVLYERYNNISSPYLERLQKDEPLVKQGLREAYDLARLEHNSNPNAGDFNPRQFGVIDFNPAGDPILGKITNLEQWNQVKIGVDEILQRGSEKIVNPTTRQLTGYGRRLRNFRNAVVDELDRLAPGDPEAGVPSYSATRSIWAGPSRAAEMMSEGVDFIRTGKSSLDVDDVNRLSQADKDFMRVGAKQQLQDMLLNSPDGSNEVRKIFGNQMMRNKIASMFDNPDEFRMMARELGVENQLFENETQLLKNSRTAFRQNAAEDFAGGAPVGVVNRLSRGDVKGAAGQLIENAVDPVIRRFTGPSPKKAEQLAVLYSQDPEVKARFLRSMRAFEAERGGRVNAQDLARLMTGGPNQ